VSRPRFAAPQSYAGYIRLTCISLLCAPQMQHIGPYFPSILVDWLTSQARYVRVWVSRRTMHASCKSPCHLSAKHCILETCLFLTAPFRTMLLTLQGGLHA